MGTKFVTMGEIMLRLTRPDYQSDATLEGLDEAIRADIYTSIDINFRKNL